MNLRPVPKTNDIEELRVWCEDCYKFLTFPVFRLANFGDSTNYAEFKEDGELNLNGTARVSQAEWMPAGATRAAGANAADEEINGSGFVVLAFDKASDEYAQTNLRIPDDMDRTASCSVRIGWSTGPTSAGMEWAYGYLYTSENDDTEGAATTGSTAATSSSTADGLVITTLFTISGGSISDDCICLHVYLFRDVSEDTIDDDVYLHGMALSYTSNKLGTAT